MNAKDLGSHITLGRGRHLIHGIHVAMLVVVFGAILSAGLFTRAKAVPLGARSVTVSTSAISATAEHDFSLTLSTAASVGSISFEYCQESPLFDYTCTAPAGLDLSSAVLSSQSGETGFSIHPSSTSSYLILTRPSSVAIPGIATYDFSNITNPSVVATTFVRVATHASTDASGPRIDEGGLAFATTNPLNVEAYVPPFIILCTGIAVAPDCSNASGASVNLGDLSANFPNTGTSQFAVATNDDAGYNAYILGTTMTSGTFVIPANNSQSPSSPGSSQFGLNLVANTNPAIGDPPSGLGTGIPSTFYDDTDLFRFQNGDLIASSILPTDFNRFTLSYLVNVSQNQSPGLYTTTMTVLGVADF